MILKVKGFIIMTFIMVIIGGIKEEFVLFMDAIQQEDVTNLVTNDDVIEDVIAVPLDEDEINVTNLVTNTNEIDEKTEENVIEKEDTAVNIEAYIQNNIPFINISSLSLFSEIHYGDSQEEIDEYPICMYYEKLLSTSEKRFNDEYIELCGHNNKLLGKTYNIELGAIINVFTDNEYNDYVVVFRDVVDVSDSGDNFYYPGTTEEIIKNDGNLYIYTCTADEDMKKRFVIVAQKLQNL